MARRSRKNAERGQLYAAEWPEWHVDCAHEGCQEHQLAVDLGEAYTLREATALWREDTNGWTCRAGRWFCPAHSETPKE